MPPKTNQTYQYQTYVIDGKSYKIPADVVKNSVRWHFWRRWQDSGLSLPTFQPAITITADGRGMKFPSGQLIARAA